MYKEVQQLPNVELPNLEENGYKILNLVDNDLGNEKWRFGRRLHPNRDENGAFCDYLAARVASREPGMSLNEIALATFG
jgi:hypothetical protein